MTRLEGSLRAGMGQAEAVGEDFDLIDIAWLAKFAATLAEPGEYGHMAANHVLEINFRHPARIVSDQDSRARDVLKAGVFDPKLIGVVGIDGNGGGHVAEFIMDQGESGLVLANGCFPLPVERGVDQCELPCRGGLSGHDPELATVEVEVLRFVRNLVDTGES